MPKRKCVFSFLQWCLPLESGLSTQVWLYPEGFKIGQTVSKCLYTFYVARDDSALLAVYSRSSTGSFLHEKPLSRKFLFFCAPGIRVVGGETALIEQTISAHIRSKENKKKNSKESFLKCWRPSNDTQTTKQYSNVIFHRRRTWWWW